jgi:hypothetical protein
VIDGRDYYLAVVVTVDRGSVLAADMEEAIEATLSAMQGGSEREVEAKAVLVSERLHGRLLDAREHAWERHGDYDG